jgi:hypothetical protein
MRRRKRRFAQSLGHRVRWRANNHLRNLLWRRVARSTRGRTLQRLLVATAAVGTAWVKKRSETLAFNDRTPVLPLTHKKHTSSQSVTGVSVVVFCFLAFVVRRPMLHVDDPTVHWEGHAPMRHLMWRIRRTLNRPTMKKSLSFPNDS